MGKQFLKSGQVSLLNGGYLSNPEGKPVYNADFVAAQRHAEYIVTFANLAKGKDFKGKKADSLEDLKAEVTKQLSAKATEFVKKPTAVSQTLTESLAAEAFAFMDFKSNSSKVDKINAFLQQFNVLNDFSEFGLFFDEEIVKLNKIYTIEEVVNAVTETIDLLG